MSAKRNFRFEESFIAAFYEKKVQIKKLQQEIDEMTEFIKRHLEREGMTYSRVGAYTTFVEYCYKPKDEFISLMRQKGYGSLIKETCIMKDFYKVCSELNLNENDHVRLWCKKLYVNKK